MQYCPGCMRPVRSSDSFCPGCGTSRDFQNKAYLLPAGTVLKDREEESGCLIGKALGQGGFGVTYIGMDMSRKQRVAVKEYFPVRCAIRGADGRTVEPKVPELEAMYEGGRFSFLKEAKMLAGLEGMPSVVQGLAYMECNNTAYLVMEYLDGTPLYRVVQERGKMRSDDGPDGPSSISEIAAGAAGRGMSVEEFFPPLRNLMWDIAKLHNRGVIHRDISPDNIMLMPDGSFKLLDFGCARSMEDGKSMTVLVKKGFAPIEQYQTHGQGPWTDVYALAATIYYCLTGIIPPASVDRLTDDAQLLSPIRLGAALTPEEESVLLWALSINPKTRPANMEVFAKHLFPFEPPKSDPKGDPSKSDAGKDPSKGDAKKELTKGDVKGSLPEGEPENAAGSAGNGTTDSGRKNADFGDDGDTFDAGTETPHGAGYGSAGGNGYGNAGGNGYGDTGYGGMGGTAYGSAGGRFFARQTRAAAGGRFFAIGNDLDGAGFAVAILQSVSDIYVFSGIQIRPDQNAGASGGSAPYARRLIACDL